MITLTNNLRKIIASLDKAKVRKETRLFLAEGDKCVRDTISYFEVEVLLAGPQWIESNQDIARRYPLCQVAKKDLERLTHLVTSPEVIAVYRIPEQRFEDEIPRGLSLVLDTIQDPGNMGTILRTADWFGVENIYCSRETVDVFSPKVVQSTMGAISRIRTVYCDLANLIERYEGSVFGTFLDGDNIYEADLDSAGLIVMGNEGKGISPGLRPLISHRLLIPSYPADRPTSESLNVATATAITLAEFRRRKYCR